MAAMSTPEGVAPATAVIGADGTVTGWTKSAERLLGHRAEEIVHRPAVELLASEEDVAKAPAMAAEVIEQCDSRDCWGGLAALRHRDGHRVDVGLRVSPLAGASGHQEGWLVSAIDLAKSPSWAVAGPVMESFLTRSPIGMAVLGPDLRYVWVNDTLNRFAGISCEQRLGRRMSEVLPGLNTDELEAQMRHVLRTGVPVIDYEYQGRTWADPHREQAYSTSFFRLDDADGNVLGVCYMGMDVTDRWRSRERLALLNEAGTCIGSTLDVSLTVQELADFAVPRMADFVTVDLLESVFGGEEPGRGTPANVAALRRTGMRSVHDGCPESIVRPGDLIQAPESSPYALCVADGKSRLHSLADTEAHPWITEDPARAERIRSFGMHSMMMVPLRARGTVLGVATFFRSGQSGPFEEDDRLLGEEVVARAAVCVDNARRWTREHTAALALQRSLLPHGLTGGSALEVASRYLPTDVSDGVGGDWFDVIPLSGARVALVVGDVVGRGLNAAATMGRLRTAVHTLADMELPPDELLAHLDDLVIRLIEDDAQGVDEQGGTELATTVLGATCLYAVYDPVTRRCTMARAGHPPPAIVDPSGAVTYPDLPAGPPLGLGSLPFESMEMELPEDTLIALYTNGLVESCAQDMEAGLTRLGLALAHPGLPLEELCGSVVDSLLDCPPADDVALLLARTHGLGPERIATWDLPTDPAIVANARSLAVRQLMAWGLEDLGMTTELVVSELVTNAIRHGDGPIRLRLIRQDVLICEVADSSSTSPRLKHARTTDEGGRGLFLVARMTRRWGTRYTQSGKLIWAEQDLPGRV
jgi:PAS domain S-box-containing protein